MALRKSATVYICCASNDCGFARLLASQISCEIGAQALIGGGLTNDSEIVSRQIRSCDLFVLIWTSQTSEESRCRFELSAAIHWGKRVLAVKCGDVPVSDDISFSLGLHDAEVIDAQSSWELEEALRRALPYGEYRETVRRSFDDVEMAARSAPAPCPTPAPPKPKSKASSLSSIVLGIGAVIVAAPVVGIGALVKGAAGLIKGRRAHKASNADSYLSSDERSPAVTGRVPETAAREDHIKNSAVSVTETTSKAGAAMPAGASSDQADGQCIEQAAPVPRLSAVRFSALAPERFKKGLFSKIDIIMYEENRRSAVDEIRAEYKQPVQETRSGVQKVREETKVRVALSSPDLELDDSDDEQTWYGGLLRFSFMVNMPTEYAKPQIRFTAQVYFDGVPATRLRFIAACEGSGAQHPQLERLDINSGFMSYASQDRARVAALMQGMQKVRPELDLFFDVESLRSGENWQEAIRREIDRRDALFLCWSHFAKQSEWVDMEWHYALEHKGESAIEPVPIEPPTDCPPPDELSHKHFNDKLLMYMRRESSSSHAG